MTGSAHDDALTRALDAAVLHVENATSVYLRSTTIREYFNGAPDPYRFTVGPVVSISAVTDTATDTVIDSTAYRIDKTGAWPVLRAVDRGTFSPLVAYSVTYVAGFATVPAPIVTAVHEVAALHFENREAATPTQLYAVPLAVSAMLANYGPRPL